MSGQKCKMYKCCGDIHTSRVTVDTQEPAAVSSECTSRPISLLRPPSHVSREASSIAVWSIAEPGPPRATF